MVGNDAETQQSLLKANKAGIAAVLVKVHRQAMLKHCSSMGVVKGFDRCWMAGRLVL